MAFIKSDAHTSIALQQSQDRVKKLKKNDHDVVSQGQKKFMNADKSTST
jgi:hypothetical protein